MHLGRALAKYPQMACASRPILCWLMPLACLNERHRLDKLEERSYDRIGRTFGSDLSTDNVNGASTDKHVPVLPLGSKSIVDATIFT
jgi:hypothetical protein